MKFFLSFLFLTLSTPSFSYIGSSLKVEGSCSGTLKDGTAVRFEYFSDFDGCKASRRSALRYKRGMEGLLTGTRRFQGNRDVHTYPQHKLSFKNSTGNTSGLFTYRDENGRNQTITVKCLIRDYEYDECN